MQWLSHDTSTLGDLQIAHFPLAVKKHSVIVSVALKNYEIQ
jgi:hypothetical protein